MFRFCYLIPLIKLPFGLGWFSYNNMFSVSLILSLPCSLSIFLAICSLLPFPCSFFNSLTSSLCAQRSRKKIKDSRGKRARPQRPAPPSQFSSLSPQATCTDNAGTWKKKGARVDFQHIQLSPPLLCLSLFVLPPGHNPLVMLWKQESSF